jgi:Flp pilus assembly protein TadB
VDVVVVYKTNPESLQMVLGLLRKEGFNPTTLEDPSSAAALSGCGKAAYLISVAVPRDEAPGAACVLRKWEQAQKPEVKSAIEKLAGPFLASLMVAGVLAVVLLFLGILLEVAALLFLVWVVTFALLANAEKISRKLKRATR